MKKQTILLSGIALTMIGISIGWRKAAVSSSTLGGAPVATPALCDYGDVKRPPTLVRKSQPAITLLPEAAEIAGRLNAPDTTTADDLEILDVLVTIFRKANEGASPAGGENDEIVSQLTGRNDKGFAVLPAKHPAISSTGRLLDRWGTPYYFHPVSRDVLGLRSAGPDGKLFNADDIILNQG
ncbi:hypothetical protein [Luteolibacter soli]|uniref:Type II secretion system protein GspG C-terminal domain-containing protein n=1 Tax=Luteolibacter soli TaxID=3135280 RepID=A0ABU9B2A7_9BACT